VFLWTFDSEIEFPDRFRLLTKHDFMNSVKIDGGGGTSFTPVFEHALKKGLNNIIILTDGCAEKVETPLPRNFRALWVVRDDGNSRQWFSEVGQPGKVVFVKDWKE
jgi:predicted metal-dependent peptidase